MTDRPILLTCVFYRWKVTNMKNTGLLSAPGLTVTLHKVKQRDGCFSTLVYDKSQNLQHSHGKPIDIHLSPEAWKYEIL